MKSVWMGGVAVTLVGFLSGCASTLAKNGVQEALQADKVYGRVSKMFDADTSENRKSCEQYKDHSPSVQVCSRLQDYEIANAYIMHLDRLIRYGVPVPRTAGVKQGYILEFNPGDHMASFRRIAATEDTNTCRWVGVTPEFLNGRGGMLTGFVAGMLIIPGAVMLATDWADGGVECEGWSYKTLAQRAKEKTTAAK